MRFDSVPASLIAALVTAIVVAVPSSGAFAQQMDCAKVLERMWRTGESPAIAINPENGTVRVTISRGYCEEPIDVWSKRKPFKPAEKGRTPKASAPMPPPEPKPQPKASAPMPAPEPQPAAPTPQITVTPEPKRQAPIPPPSGAACDLRIEQLWQSVIVEIEGIPHWLARAFTLDVDDIEGVEDVGFVLKAGNGTERQFRYFGTPDEVPARELAGIGLQDDGLVRRLCFGDVHFRMPPFFGESPEQKLMGLDRPNLAAEAKARQEGRSIESGPKKGGRTGMVTETGPGWWLWVAVGGGIVVLGAVFFLWRRQVKRKLAAKKAEEEEEDEDDFGKGPKRKGRLDDDEEEDEAAEKAKPGRIAAFFGRVKGAEGKEDEDEDADEEGAEKPRKAKKGGFFGLFKGKAKKAAKENDEEEGGARK